LLTLKFADIIIETEENPIGLLIIKKYGVYVFMAAKAIGTICACLKQNIKGRYGQYS
jgi:hypothetical protein